MNSRKICPIKEDRCMICGKNKKKHTYYLYASDDESIFPYATKFQCCSKCNDSGFMELFKNTKSTDQENMLQKFILSLPIEGRELFENRFSSLPYVEPQDWLDFQLHELADQRKEQYGNHYFDFMPKG